MNDWESKVAAPDVPIAPYNQVGDVRHFHLTASPIEHSILPEIKIKALGYNGSTPGPLIIMRQGDWIRLTVENRLDEPTALHVHGLSKPNTQDGVPDIEPTPKIQPGQCLTYTFKCWQAGTFFYHSAQAFQSAQGLIGSFIVLPRDAGPSQIPDKDYVLLLQQWQIPQPELGKVFPGIYEPVKFDINPNFFTINGKAFPHTSSLVTKYGERVRVRFINKSSSAHSMHTHGHDFKVMAVNAFPRQNLWNDTINVASGTRWEVEFIANNPGVWPINGTKTFHQSNNGETPGGMITRLIYC